MVAIQLSNMPVAQKDILNDCAQEMVSESSKNLSVLLIDSECSLLTSDGTSPLSSSQCSQVAQRSDVVVGYKSKGEVLFSADPPRAYMYGDAEYFESCPLKVFVG